MRVICTATVDSLLRRDNLCEKIDKLGVVPIKANEIVYAEYEGDEPTAEKLIQLFENERRHDINIIKP